MENNQTMKDAKEKAKELVEQFTFRCKECDYDWNAKLSAIISVKHVMDTLYEYHYDSESGAYNYWIEVKSEIEKL